MTLKESKNIKIGDTVECLTSFKNLPQEGWKGKVINIQSANTIYCTIQIEWEKKFVEGHDCNGMCGSDRGRNYFVNSEITQDISILKMFTKTQLEFDF